MKPRNTAESTPLRVLLAVKGQADNQDFVQILSGFTEAPLELANPRAIRELDAALAAGSYHALLCDIKLLDGAALARLRALRGAGDDTPLWVFGHELDDTGRALAVSLGAVATFTTAQLPADARQALVAGALRLALQQRRLARLAPPALRRHADGYLYHARLDEHGRLRNEWLSDGFEAVTGYSREAIAARGGWITCVHGEDRPAVARFLETLLEGETARVLYRATARDGDTLWLESVGEPVRDGAGKVVGVVGQTRRVNEREAMRRALTAAERQRNALAKLAAACARPLEPDTLLKEAVLSLTQALDAWLCELHLLEADGSARLAAATGVPSRQIGKRVTPLDQDNELRHVVHSGRPLLCEDLRSERRFQPSTTLRRQKALSGVLVPVATADGVAGTLGVWAKEPGAFDRGALEFVAIAGTLIGIGLSRAAARSDLRRTRDSLLEETRAFSPPAEIEAAGGEDDISIIVKTAKELRSRNVILAAASRATGLLIDAEDWRSTIHDVLEELGRAAQAARAYLFRVDGAQGDSADLHSEWVNDGVAPRRDDPACRHIDFAAAGLARFLEVLRRGGVVVGTREEFEPAERAFLERAGAFSAALVPIFVEGRLWGFLGFDSTQRRRHWSTAEIDALSIAANTLSTALARRQNEIVLQAIQESTVRKTGQAYFRSLLEHLAVVFEADLCFIARHREGDRFAVDHALIDGKFIDPFEFEQAPAALTGDPPLLHHVVGAARAPGLDWLAAHEIEGHLAVPVIGSDDRLLGQIAVCRRGPLQPNARHLQVLRIFAARVAVEIEREQMEQEIQQLARLSLENPNMVMSADLDGAIRFANPACEHMARTLGLADVEELLPPEHKELIARVQHEETRALRTERRLGERHLQWDYHLQSDLARVHLFGMDMTEHRELEARLRRDAFHDPLTGLPNRSYFNNLLEHALERARRRGDYDFAVLYLDLDRFKYINDSLGHAHGDRFLEAVATRLKACLRPGDHIARLGGDEFAILLEQVTDVQEAVAVADRVQQALAKPIALGQHEAYTSASIGIALSSLGYDNPQTLLRDADIAMYSAKQAGKARHAVFDRRMYDDMVNVMRLEVDLRNALANGELCVHYQPIYSIAERRLAGFEALVRWKHPQRGFLEPHDFIPLAEEMSIIRDIDYLVLDHALAQLRRWHTQHEAARNLKMHVNLSAIHFNGTAILAQIGNALKDNRLSNDCLQLELTESVLMDHSGRSAQIFDVLTRLGVHISIDDFGVGYSSLSRLTKLPVNMLKIDRGFVQSMVVDSSSLDITRAVIDLAHDLNMAVIAEGVETQRQYQILARLGCQYVQGFYVARPMPAEEAEAFLLAPPVFE